MKNKLAIILTLSFALILALILNLLVEPALAESMDQSNDVSRDHVANRGTWGQSFTPTMKLLTQVDLALDSVGNINSYTVTVNILESWNGPILGSATAAVPPGVRNDDVREFVPFIFPTPIELIPWTQYIIQVELEQYYHQGGTSDMISWYIHDIDSYAGGVAIQDGIERSEDMIFRTWGGMLTEERAYDDGKCDYGVSHNVGKHLAVKFSLPYGWLEAKLLTARYYIFAGATSFKAHVYGSDGATELTSSLHVTPQGNGWFDVDLTGFNIVVTSDFYVTIEYETDYNPKLGSDASPPIDGFSYEGTPGSWHQKTTEDYMIRIVMRQVMHEPVYPEDLIINGNDAAIIRGNFKINGSIIIEENAALTLENALLNFTQNEYYEHNITLKNPLQGKPRLLLYNSTITSNFKMPIEAFDNSSVTIDNSSVAIHVVGFESSEMSISNSYIYRQIAYDQNVAKISNSTIIVLESYSSTDVWVNDSKIFAFIFGPNSVECTVSKLKPGLASYWNFITNCSVNVLPTGYAPNITLINTLTYEWNLCVYGNSNVSIYNSTLGHFSSFDSSVIVAVDSTFTHDLHVSSSSILSLVNSTYSGEPLMRNQAQIQVSWYLDVHVIDSIGQNVPSATVEAIYPNTTIAKSTLTDSDGWARLTLIEKMLNATGEYTVGNYNIKATYNSYSNETTVNMTENKQITLKLEDFVILEFPSNLILQLLMIATLLAIITYKSKRLLTTKHSTNQSFHHTLDLQ
ncbi:MAG: carboxypeptidase-like regulatory domain-containing protein [Candidatus Bathyarchaeia archaeon]